MPTVEELFATAVAHHQAGQLPLAEEMYRQILSADPSHADAWHLLGLIASQTGNAQAAIDLIGRAIAIRPNFPEACYNLGLALHQRGRVNEAVTAYSRAVSLRPDFSEAHNNLGAALKDEGKLHEAAACYRRAIELKPDYAEAHCNLGNAYKQQGMISEAIDRYRRAIDLCPNMANAHHGLAGALKAAGKLGEAITSYERAIELRPNYAEAHNNLGNAQQTLGNLDQAVACFRSALAIDQNNAEAHGNLGNALQAAGLLDEAVACYRRALALKPGDFGTCNNLGNALLLQGKHDQAIASYRRALQIKPDYGEAWVNLGNACKELGRVDEAVDAYHRALTLNPQQPEAWNNLGNAIKDQGKVAEALACFRRAVELKPDFTVADSNLLYTLHFSPEHDSAAIYAEHCRWNRQHAEPLAKLIQPHANDRTSNRRLRVGYVSPDFYDHCQSFFTVPLFTLHDRTSLEVFCYSDVVRPDAITDVLRSKADAWRIIVGATDEAVAEQVRRDGIDILVDLSMHMAHGRPLVFARKPAPVQVCWFAYPGTTGLTAIDYRLTDPQLDPQGQDDRFYSEKSIRLADTFWCYDPLTREPAVNTLPALESGRITFGSLNNFCKINPPLLKLWARVLRATGDSRLVLLAAAGSHRQRALELLEQESVSRERVTFFERQPRPRYLELYHRVDIGLDTLPYNGHVTNLDALWMGVPVVTLVGQTIVGRGGLSQLTNLGLTDFIARTADEYVRIAVGLAGDLPRLAKLRRSLREQMQRSPLMDQPRFARSIEAAYRMMWQRWCAAADDAAA